MKTLSQNPQDAPTGRLALRCVKCKRLHPSCPARQDTIQKERRPVAHHKGFQKVTSRTDTYKFYGSISLRLRQSSPLLLQQVSCFKSIHKQLSIVTLSVRLLSLPFYKSRFAVETYLLRTKPQGVLCPVACGLAHYSTDQVIY